jgi:hypothetical protein
VEEKSDRAVALVRLSPCRARLWNQVGRPEFQDRLQPYQDHAMPRAYWKGYLRLSLVTCPIELFPATSQAEKTHFHQINTQTGHRLRQQMVDEETGRVVDSNFEIVVKRIMFGGHIFPPTSGAPVVIAQRMGSPQTKLLNVTVPRARRRASLDVFLLASLIA